ncbi:MAG TPA: ATP-dependent DNA helicase RecQ [Bacteroidaceae bacterium]|jgi:ATP-dependent DNA helicase RecQ|nr:RecQ family ATP-dependent DNA helicase [Bacteroidaceae bacterium]MBP8602735.1 RecQ family ATP-dependent DNA helicase [Bacteroidaceae bacterium]HOD67902.1 ATP-dependent DNA helicase RecQ [Bacteroidaceae bacterium]HPB03278.1 ATP-dependent DNA helicase RecQ [Bacteroidaceae bacterium]HQL25438.1 ATP-dependent DNA helicase RecQ [Bacteroidaceae bacterium]
MTYREILKHYWGYESFRGVQEQIIESIGSGRDTLGLMPTGGGKSITFQVPALATDGVCLVISPLIALMKDQVRILKDYGIKAISIQTGMRRDEIISAMENCIFGGYKFLYVSPERLSSDLFKSKLKSIKVNLITVDESHCISQWGYDFRPSYLQIAEIRKLLPGVPVLALTATATSRVADDIQDKLGFPEKNVIRMSFYRENLSYVVRTTENKLQELKHILNNVPGSAIVYVRNRRETKVIADFLNSHDIPSVFYHAGIDPILKDERQRAWTEDRYRVVVATNAFGMGIDKPDVRAVIHMDIPNSVEAYFQEAGRGGRDGKRSYAVLLFSPGDKRIISKRISDNFPKEDFIRNIYEKLGFYHEMAVGDGRGCSYSFSLGEFCRHFSLPVIPTDSALRILTRMGYIEYSEEADFSAKLLFTARRDELYLLRQDTLTEQIMNVILRLYGGIFADYTFIDEQLICSRVGTDRRTLYTVLTNLQNQGIVRYVPERKTPLITWTRQRVDTDKLRFDPEVYRLRKEEFKERIGAMTEYITRATGCRSAMLLKYFGETQEMHCMHCDLCQEKVSGHMTRGEKETITNAVTELLKEDGDPREVYSLPYPKKKIDIILHSLVNEGMIKIENGTVIYNNPD